MSLEAKRKWGARARVRLKLEVSDGCRRKSGRGLPHSKTWRNFLRSGRAQSVLIGGQSSTLTGSFSRTPLSCFTDQIVIRMADDLYACEFARRGIPADVDPAINIRRVCFPSSHEVISLQLGGMLVRASNKPVFPRINSGAAKLFGTGFLFDQHPQGSAN